ncbi:MAG: peptidoglycan DD-metalloendopeptidase family protein [Acidimicrobiia bacterium]|nr:peptidoglycan DD-metalloendopeptidase family protein [Acidimicrobiia bacterium]
MFASAFTALLVLALPVAGATDEPFSDMIFPQDADVTEYVDSWGAARSGGRGHQGTDLMAPKMTPVYAVDDGKVKTMKTHGLAGRYLVIEHEGGWESWYIHLNNDNPGTDDGDAPMDLTYGEGVEIGARVHQGDVIGWVGDSGNAEGSGSHTHFELHVDDVAINPYPHLRRAELNELADVIYHEVVPGAIGGDEPTSTDVSVEPFGLIE